MKNFERLRILRETIGVSQSEFARTLGVAPSFISGIERDQKDVSRDLLQKLLEKCQVNINWLLSGEGEMFLESEKNPIQSEKPSLIAELGALIDQRLEKIEAQISEIEGQIKTGPSKDSDADMFVSEPEPEYGEDPDNIAFVDNVAAGRPIYQSDSPSYIEVPKRFIKTKPEDYYVGRVKGTSMVAAGIPDGVLILLRISDVPRDGAIQIVQCRGEVTLKRIREVPGKGWKICFDDYSGRYIEIGPEDEFQVQGDFVAILPDHLAATIK